MFDPPDVPSPAPKKGRVLLFGAVAVVIAFLGMWLEHAGEHAVAPNVALPWVLPFVVLLGCIATMPFVAKHFWEHYYPHVAVGLGAIVGLYYLFVLKTGGNAHEAMEAAATAAGGEGGPLATTAWRSMAKSFGEYISFIFLLGSLFTISGGILISVRRKATPTVNTVLLLTGAIIANIFGTTGAAMLLIRPFLRINKGHIKPYHIVFFIFIVANVGGSLTPIGDPPLFLGYLKGVPFWWVLEQCWPMWLVAVGVLLAVFFLIDTLAHRKETRAEHSREDLGPAVSIFGMGNLLLVFAVLAGILLHEQLVHMVHIPWRELIMVAAVTLSLLTTPRRIHVENVFNFAPIREVALLFVGIFATMVPALNYLSNHAEDPALRRYLHTPGQYYFTSGTLSSVLDNAPTYLTFLATEAGKLPPEAVKRVVAIVEDPTKPSGDPEKWDKELEADLAGLSPEDQQHAKLALGALMQYHRDKVRSGGLTYDQVRVGFLLGEEQLEWYIIAISLGSVFFGAMTYIGNGPNFMVKSIAENAGVKCPSFFGYIGMYSVPILLPILILIWLVFLAGHAGH
jgi:Na+/H+ antiporter NhaD/arsenite permease-like protein